MNKERVLQGLDNLKGSLETMDYGKWGTLNVEQRNFMRALCNSWLILEEATNKQTEEIERLNNIINELEKYIKECIEEMVKNKVIRAMIDIRKDDLAALQELKGSDKE